LQKLIALIGAWATVVMLVDGALMVGRRFALVMVEMVQVVV
jgi:hypothetical protein